MEKTLSLGRYVLKLIASINLVRNPDGSVMESSPQPRYQNSRGLPLNKYGGGTFYKFKISNKYRLSGVYAITADEELKYIGESANLSSWFNTGYGNISPKNCFVGGQETNCRINQLILSASKKGQYLELWFFESADYKFVESELRTQLKPIWNKI